ncbi:MAG: DUF4383 domain-containing protein [Candidatus Woesearchaeota archaeon]|jgi:hypothetical protein|nr:DUF4383 domain-containing protein [Candidatus Woesearchaeota archaeon]MDP7458534.1 DUF4383 domain-containing protein [Candidatus Woesearchaeota archaeon]
MSLQKTFALVLGIILGIVGIWGLFTDMILGIFGVNVLHSVLHLIAAAFGIFVGIKGEGPGYNQVIGWVGVALGILGFIPGVKDLLLTVLNINTTITVLHLVIGIVALGVFYGAKEKAGAKETAEPEV